MRTVLGLSITLCAFAASHTSEAALPIPGKKKPINLEIPAPKVLPAAYTGTYEYDHSVFFIPDPSGHDKVLGSVAAPYIITQAVGFGPLTVTNPPAGTYHTGAVAASEFILNPWVHNAATGKVIFTGSIEWGQEAPSPSVFHGEVQGHTLNFTKMILTGGGNVGASLGVPFNVKLNRPDDGVTGGAATYSAADQDECVFHAIWTVIPRNLDSHSTPNWTVIPRQTGHPFHGKLDSRSVATRGELVVL